MVLLRQKRAPRGRLPRKGVQIAEQRNVTEGEREGESLGSRGAAAAPNLAASASAASTAEKESVRHCVGGSPDGTEDVSVRVRAGGETLRVPLDTGRVRYALIRGGSKTTLSCRRKNLSV